MCIPTLILRPLKPGPSLSPGISSVKNIYAKKLATLSSITANCEQKSDHGIGYKQISFFPA
jgi:hypothetical protein